MYLAIDVGGTKTFVATFSDEQTILQIKRISTNQDYGQFLHELEPVVHEVVGGQQISAGCIAVAGEIEREFGVGKVFGNLPWRDVTIRDDIGKIINIPLVLENDAKAAGFAEAQQLPEYPRILYITLGTGIGIAFMVEGQLVPELLNTEGGKMPLLHDNQYVAWEDFASGRAISERFNKLASDITDSSEWQQIAELLGQGLGPLCAVFQVDAVIFGGGAGQHADQFIEALGTYLKEHLHPVVQQPKALLKAKYGDDSVIYGCYYLAKQYAKTD